MHGKRLRRLRRLFEQALDHPAENREALVNTLCPDDPELVKELLTLLRRDRMFTESDVTGSAGLESLARAALPEAFLEGQIVGPFRIIECIGTGGMGAVYRVQRIDGEVQQEAALKLLRPGYADAAMLGRFSNERRLLASLNHPGISRFLDAGTLKSGQPFVLMELIRGTPILEYCEEHKLGVTARLGLLLQVLDAVAYAHSRLVVHRDIKSGNVLVTDQGQPKLLDFGIAKTLDASDADRTMTRNRILTPGNAAPEQYRAEPVGIGCDIYALGVLMYELLCGLPPFDFEGKRAGQVEEIVLTHPPPLMSQRVQSDIRDNARGSGPRADRNLVRTLRGDLDIIAAKCLRKRPEERYPTLLELRDDLLRVLSRRPIRARSNERWYRMRRFAQRNRIPVMLGSILIVTALTSLGVSWFQAAQTNRERSIAMLERDKARHALNLLKEAFVSADPAQVQGGNVTALQILQSARQSLDSYFESQPALFADLAAVIAEVQIELTLNDDAAELSALAIDAAVESGASREVQRNLWLLRARALLDTAQRDAAEEAIGRVAELDTREHADLLVVQGRRLIYERRIDEAVAALQRAVGLTAGQSPEDRVAVDARWQLSHAQSLAGLHDESIETLDRTLAWLSRDLAPHHPHLTRTRLWRIDALRRGRRFDQAELKQRGMEDEVYRHYGRGSAMAGRAHVTFGMLRFGQRRFDEAIGHYREAIAIWDDLLSENHPNLLRAWINLAQSYYYLTEIDPDAEKMFQEVLSNATEQLGAGTPAVLTMEAFYARHLLRQDRPVEALLMLSNTDVSMISEGAVPKFWRQTLEEVRDHSPCTEHASSEMDEQACSIAMDRARRLLEIGSTDS